MITLSNFNDFFATFSLFSLAYAGSEVFRSIIDDDILKMTTSVSPEIKRLENEIKSVSKFNKFEKSFTAEIDAQVAEAFAERQESVDVVMTRASKAKEISESFKSMFLFTGFYGLFLIAFSGFQEVVDNCKFNFFIFLFNFGLIFNIFVLCRSFSEYGYYKIKPVITIIIFFFYLILASLLSKYIDFDEEHSFFNLTKGVVLCLITCISPFVFHIIRLLYLKVKFQIILNKGEMKCKKTMIIIQNFQLLKVNNKKK